MARSFSKAALILMAEGITLNAVARGADISAAAVSMQLSGENKFSQPTLISIRAIGGADIAKRVAALATEAFDERRKS